MLNYLIRDSPFLLEIRCILQSIEEYGFRVFVVENR